MSNCPTIGCPYFMDHGECNGECKTPKEKLRYYEVSTEYVVRRRHKRLIVARSPEEALADYNRGTAWPSDYDTLDVETRSEDPTKVEEISNYQTEHLGDPNDSTNWDPRIYFAEGLGDLYPFVEPVCKDPAACKDALARGADPCKVCEREVWQSQAVLSPWEDDVPSE